VFAVNPAADEVEGGRFPALAHRSGLPQLGCRAAVGIPAARVPAAMIFRRSAPCLLRSLPWLALPLMFLGCREDRPLSPSAVVAARDGQTLFVACATTPGVVALAPSGEVRRRVALPGTPNGLALSPDGRTLAVTCAAPASTVCLLAADTGAVTARFAAGHTATAPVFAPDGRTLYVCNRFDDEVAVLDVATGRTLARIPVVRQPIAAALTPDGRRLFVANHLHGTRADGEVVAAAVSVIDTATRAVVATLTLPNGSGLLLGVAVSPDGHHVAVAHNLARHQLPTTQVERGWMNSAALTLIDAGALRVIATLLLDEVDAGAANPWGVAWTSEGRQLVVTHAGTHEVSIIDGPGVLVKLARLPAGTAADAPASDLAFLLDLRRRVPLAGNGPRAVVIVGAQAWVAGYFSDSVEVVELADPRAKPRLLAMAPPRVVPPERLGEQAFNDARLCFQHWQSCASCHSFDARVDGFNWDLLNDGLGNPKNAKSMLLAHRTPPAMSTGVRDSAEVAVRAGFRHIQFAYPPEETAAAVDAYLKSLRPVPSPRLEGGRFSAAARRGQRVFEDPQVACATCHSGSSYTDLKSYDVGTEARFDAPGTLFDTPTLVEGWRTAPYLHDGSARTMREVLVERNRADRHGRTSHLTPQQLDDLVAYLLSI
jgi:YVTN family beta-propeller protein